MRRRLGAILPAVAAMLAMAALLGALTAGTVTLMTLEEGVPTAAEALRSWALFSAISLPLGFVFGIPLLAVARSVRRRSRPTWTGPEAAAEPPRGEAE
ncbi:MAG: hypothetical protein AAF845_10400 [Bacteroidota bacterium]